MIRAENGADALMGSSPPCRAGSTLTSPIRLKEEGHPYWVLPASVVQVALAGLDFVCVCSTS